MRVIAGLLGLIFLVIAIVYFVEPAGSLPGFFPGFEAGSTHMHLKHAVGALVVAVVLFIISWLIGRRARTA